MTNPLREEDVIVCEAQRMRDAATSCVTNMFMSSDYHLCMGEGRKAAEYAYAAMDIAEFGVKEIERHFIVHSLNPRLYAPTSAKFIAAVKKAAYALLHIACQISLTASYVHPEA